MKKIVSAVALAAAVAGMASAEVKTSVNFRTRQVLYHEQAGQRAYFLDQFGLASTSDALTFKSSAEYGGIELEIDPTYNGSTTSLDLAKYNGWINFGDFMIKAGKWDSRAVGRVNADIGSHESGWWGEIKKPGLAAAFATNGMGADISEQSSLKGSSKKMTTMVQYNNKDIGLEARAAYINEGGADTWVSENVTLNETGFFGELGYKINGFGRILWSNKWIDHAWATGLFVEPKLDSLSALTSLIGFTYEYKNEANSDDDSHAWAVDLRARYAFNDKLSATLMLNASMGTAAKMAGNGSYANWGMVNVTYKANETIHPFFSIVYNSGSSSSAVSKASVAARSINKSYTCDLLFYPGVEIYNTASANIITGLAVRVTDLANADSNTQLNLCVPMLLRVKF